MYPRFPWKLVADPVGSMEHTFWKRGVTLCLIPKCVRNFKIILFQIHHPVGCYAA